MWRPIDKHDILHSLKAGVGICRGNPDKFPYLPIYTIIKRRLDGMLVVSKSVGNGASQSSLPLEAISPFNLVDSWYIDAQ